MELIERNTTLEIITQRYITAARGTGHAVFIMGEAGIGKTSLVNNFLASLDAEVPVFSGSCDALATPQPLGPLYDIALQAGTNFLNVLRNEKDRALIFTTFLQELLQRQTPVVLVLEDIHWADEATIDFIKFLTRRINKLKCLVLLTCRDNQLTSGHRIKMMFGDLPAENFSKLWLETLSPEAVDVMAVSKGYESGKKVYELTGGNPFYVMEVLANHRGGIPSRIKDSVLAVFHSNDENTQALWELLSILPSRIELNLLEVIEHQFPKGIDQCIQSGVLVDRKDYLSFKHELFRITIEESLSVYRRKSLHKQMLTVMLKDQQGTNRARILHHARFAGENAIIAEFAPAAAKEAAAVGAHREAADFYELALDNIDKGHPDFVTLLELHAYECYLTNQLTLAVASQTRALEIWHHRKDPLKEGDARRFLSRLCWYSGDGSKALAFAKEAIDILENGFPTRERALAYSNLSQLRMLANDRVATLDWGNKAIDLATRLHDSEVLAHALNNIGSVLTRFADTEKEGEDKLLESLSLAIKNNLQEHAARAYTNLSYCYVLSKKYSKAKKIFEKGLVYCEDHQLSSWTYYMLSEKVRMLLGTGEWKEAEKIGVSLYDNHNHTPIIRIGVISALAQLYARQGNFDKARALVDTGKKLARLTGEAQRIVPVLVTELELCWLTNEAIPQTDINEAVNSLFSEKNYAWHFADLAFWMLVHELPLDQAIHYAGPLQLQMKGDWENAAVEWASLGCQYESALALLEGDDEHKKKALLMLDDIRANATADLIRGKLKQKGIKNIPRGLRASTRNNIAQLTTRQIDVLKLLKEGLQNKEIADRLFISAKTVDHHISAILSQLEVSSRAKAVLEAVRQGILK